VCASASAKGVSLQIIIDPLDEPRLVRRILNDVGDEPGNLPTLALFTHLETPALELVRTASGWRCSVGVAVPSELRRRAVQAAYLGFFVDVFDVYLPIAVLAPALPYFIPGGLSGAAQRPSFMWSLPSL
jgi:hypothetical protein